MHACCLKVLIISLWKQDEQTRIPFTLGCFLSSLVEIGPLVLEKGFLNVAITLLSPLGKGCDPLFLQTWIPFIQGGFVLSLVEIGPLVLQMKIFFNLSMYFHYFVITSSWKKAGPFIWTNLIHFQPRINSAKFDWNWPSGSGEKDFYNMNVFFQFRYYLPFI